MIKRKFAALILLVACPAFVSADPNDPNTLNVTLFDSLNPDDMGIAADVCEYDGYCIPLALYDEDSWWTEPVLTYAGTYIFGEFALRNVSFDQEARPWVRMTAYDYSAGGCETGDADLGDGWCRKALPAAVFGLVPANDWAYIPGSFLDLGDYFQIDNVELEFINSNIEIDFEPWNATATIRPKEAYFTTVGVKTLSVADGDPVDFDATQIDPATAMFGPGRAVNVATPLNPDFDSDGDIDIVFGFRVEGSGVSCLDESVTFVAKTYSGDPVAGQTPITTLNCQETVEIDVDPFNSANVIRPNDSYNVTVAIFGLSTADGDAVNLTPGTGTADDIDTASLKFGPAEAGSTTTPVLTDLDGDSNDDVLVTFNAYDAGIACDDTELAMVGQKLSGIQLEAVDIIQTEDCSTDGCHP